MKLGFLLQITQDGNPSDGFSVNKNELWANRVISDVRTAIKLNNYYGTEKVVYLVQFLGSIGYLICVIKASPEGSHRPDDNTAAWVFFPADIEISVDQTINILKIVEEAISQKKRTDYERLEELFSQEYNKKDILFSAVSTISSKKGSVYAIRYYNGDFTLNELLGLALAQQEYGNYQGVILVDKSLNITHISQNELNFEPQKISVFNPLSPIDGFQPCILSQNNQYRPFDKSIEVPSGTQITVYWVRNGYGVIMKSFPAQGGPECPTSAKINQSEYRILIPKKLFYVTDNNGLPISQFEVRINHQLMDGESMEITESHYQRGIDISITSKGYAEWRKSKVHPYLDRRMDVHLSKRLYHYEFKIPICQDKKETSNDATISIETYHKLKSSPIKGYIAYDRIQEGEGHYNRLYWDDHWLTKFKYVAYGFISCIFVLLMYAGCSVLENYEFQLGWPPIKEASHPQPKDWAQNVNESPANTDFANAVNYLESNDIWHKDSLDGYETTRGLFEELNSFNVSALEQRSSELIKGSEKLSDLVSTLRKYIDDQKNPRIGKENNGGNYNSSDDNIINVGNYKKWLSEEHSPYVAPTVPVDKTKGQKSKITGEKKETSTVNVSTESGQQSQSGTKRGKLPQ